MDSLSKQQNCECNLSGHISQNACHKNVMKLGYKGEIKTIIFIFFVPKSQNSNEEGKNSITAKEPAWAGSSLVIG